MLLKQYDSVSGFDDVSSSNIEHTMVAAVYIMRYCSLLSIFVSSLCLFNMFDKILYPLFWCISIMFYMFNFVRNRNFFSKILNKIPFIKKRLHQKTKENLQANIQNHMSNTAASNTAMHQKSPSYKYVETGKALSLLGITTPKSPQSITHKTPTSLHKSPTEPVPSNFDVDAYELDKQNIIPNNEESPAGMPLKVPTKMLQSLNKHENECVDIMELSSLKSNEHKNDMDPQLDSDIENDSSTTIDSLKMLVRDGFYLKKDINSLDELRKYSNWHHSRNIQNGQINTEPLMSPAKNKKNTTTNFAKSRSDRRFNKSLSFFS